MFRSNTFKIILIVLVIIVIAGAIYAFAAANTVEDSNVGYGVAATAITGYDITNIVYVPDPVNASLLDAITFDVAPLLGGVDAQTVEISVTAAQDFGSSTCSENTPPSWTCTFTTSINVVDVVKLEVYASSNP